VPKREPPHLFTPAPVPVAALDEPERLACLRLIRSSNVGPVTFRELVNHCGGARQALAALPELSRRARNPVRITPEPEAAAELEAARAAGARPVFTIEPGYPPLLAMIEAPPPLVYIKGRSALLARPAVAIVGSRHASAAGAKLARMFAHELAASGLAVVSGLARGIDAAAHEASLAFGTLAALAGGIDIVYPPEHRELQERIAAEGCLITEQPPGFVPRAKDFPRRNRLISGLALGVVVVEAARRSGTLVTARFAAEQGREVFALPGHPLDPRAEGTNQLLKAGATLATEPRDVLEALAPLCARAPWTHSEGMTENTGCTGFDAGDGVVAAQPPASDPGDPERARVLAALGPHPIDIDEIVRATALDARAVRILLMELDLAGEIERHGQQLVSRAVR